MEGSFDTIYKGMDNFCEIKPQIDESLDCLTVGITFEEDAAPALPRLDATDTVDLFVFDDLSKFSLDPKESDERLKALYASGG